MSLWADAKIKELLARVDAVERELSALKAQKPVEQVPIPGIQKPRETLHANKRY